MQTKPSEFKLLAAWNRRETRARLLGPRLTARRRLRRCRAAACSEDPGLV